MYSGWGSELVRVGGGQELGEGLLGRDFHWVRQRSAREDTGHGSHATPTASQEAGKRRPGQSVAERGGGVHWGPTRKAWNVEIRAWKSGVTPGLHAVPSRRVGGYGGKKQETEEEAVRMENEVCWGNGGWR